MTSPFAHFRLCIKRLSPPPVDHGDRLSASNITDDKTKGLKTMRRMMHAAVFLVAISSFANAQSPFVPARTVSDSVLLNTPEPDPAEAVAEPAHGNTIHVAPEMMRYDAGRSHSQLAAYMSCNDCSPNLWCNYSAERAALAAKLHRHLGNCDCLNPARGLHSHACGAGCDGGCGIGLADKCGGKIINRYRSPMATLHAAPSTNCGTGLCGAPAVGCDSSAVGYAAPVFDAPCTTCNQGTTMMGTPTSSQQAPVPPSVARPPQDRVAIPAGYRPAPVQASAGPVQQMTGQFRR